MIIHIDFETKSSAPLPEVGSWKYATDPTTDIICMGYAVDGGPVMVWEPGQDVPAVFDTSGALFVARNALFDFAICYNIAVPRYGFPSRMMLPENWDCTAAMSRQLGLPGSLEKCGEALQIQAPKQVNGKALIRKYSMPQKDKRTGAPYFNEWEYNDKQEMFDYCKADVEADRQCYKIMSTIPGNHTLERGIFIQDFYMNIQGVRIDIDGLDKVLDVLAEATERAEKEAEKYGVNVASPVQLKKYLASKGLIVDSVDEASLDEIETDDKEVNAVIALRGLIGKASVKKFQAIKDRLCFDGRIRGFLKYYGASTGRWSSEGVQLHNLPKSGVDGLDAEQIDKLLYELNPAEEYAALSGDLKKILPGLLIPNEGEKFIMGDFAAIEARVLAYLSGQADLLQMFKDNAKIYEIFAARILGCKVEDIDREKRKIGKVPFLGAGYQMGAEKLRMTAGKMGIVISADMSKRIVDGFRRDNPLIVAFWNRLQTAFQTGGKVGLIDVKRVKNRVEVTLPGGRVMYYHKIKTDGRDMMYFNYSRGFDVKLYGGLICENICQAAARDILVDCMGRLNAVNIPTAASVHDEIIGRITDDAQKADFDAIMNTPPVWLPGFPLKTESVISRRYFK